MNILNLAKTKVSPQCWIWGCRAAVVFWFVLLYPYLNWFHPTWLPKSATPTRDLYPCDFGQYYMGAQVVKHGLWPYLYSKPRPEIYEAPHGFEPSVKTFLYDEKAVASDKSFYPHCSNLSVAIPSPQLYKVCPNLDVYCNIYLYPPPYALLLSPLALSNDDVFVAYKIMPALLIFSLFGRTLIAAAIFRQLKKKPTYWEGWILLLGIFYSLWGPTNIEYGNTDSLLSFLLAFCAYAWLRGWQKTLGILFIPLLISKALVLSWCFLLLLGKRWKALVSLAIGSAAINAATLYLAGWQTYATFFNEVLPKIVTPQGFGLIFRFQRVLGCYPSKFWLSITLMLIFAIYYLFWRGYRETKDNERHPSVLLAAFIGLLSIFCLFNNTLWENYACNYIYMPFIGWFISVYQNNQNFHWRLLLIGSLVLAFSWLPEQCFFHQSHSPLASIFRYRNTMLLALTGTLILSFYQLTRRSEKMISQSQSP